MKRYLNLALCTLLTLVVFNSIHAKDSKSANAFEIKVKINNYPDSLNNVLLLGRYYANSQYITDTATYNPASKEYIFSSEKVKEAGLYLLISADKRFTEFILDKNQVFGIETSYPNMGESVKFTNSPENQLYMDFAAKNKADYLKMDDLQKEYKAAQEINDTTSLSKIREELSQAYKRLDKHREDFMAAHPENLMAAVFKAQKEVEVPQAPESVPDSLKREWQYEYYKEHYFDNLDLCDSRLIYTPIFHMKYENYMEKVLYMQSPDTIKYTLERFIEKSRCNKEIFKYAVWYPVDKYQRSDIIGQDAIWVHLAKKYYLTGEAFWATPSIIENFAKRIKRVEPLLIGNTPAEFACPDTTVDTPNERFISVFSSPKKYTILIFWSMSCGHCKTTMPKWLEFYHTKGKELDVEIMTICKDFEVEEWKKYITEHKFDFINLCGKTASLDYNDAWDIISTPTVYILDWKKRIVTKKIEPQHAEDFIKMWDREHPYKK